MKNLLKKIEELSWDQYISFFVIGTITTLVIITGLLVFVPSAKESDVPEHSGKWEEYEKIGGKTNDSVTNYQSKLAGTNESNDPGPFTSDMGNSKSPTVEGSQYSLDDVQVDNVDSALPMPSRSVKKDPWEDYPNTTPNYKYPTEGNYNIGTSAAVNNNRVIVHTTDQVNTNRVVYNTKTGAPPVE